MEENQKYLDLLQQSDLTCKALIELLNNVSELMRGDVDGYAKQVADRTLVLATGLGLKKPETHYLYYAALLHEIGVFCVPPKLQKGLNNQKLTPEEVNLLKRVPEMSYLLLMSVDILRPVAKIILHHQEYLDGSGYPKKLSGEQIPYLSQILAVTVDYHKIIAGKFFQESIEDFKAFGYIKERSGVLYNEAVVQKFSEILSFDQLPKNKNDQKIVSTFLKPGMILARTLFSSTGLELFQKCHVLTQKDIDAICNIESTSGKQLEIFVMDTKAMDYSNPFVQADLDLREISILLGDNINLKDIN